MKKILLDTDIILDFFFDRKPWSDFAAEILSLCENDTLKGYITPISISNMYYILRKTAKHQKVIDNISKLIRIVDVVSIDKKIVREALESGFNDFEDALQNYSALSNANIDIIITRNIKDYKKSTLAVMTAESYLKAFR